MNKKQSVNQGLTNIVSTHLDIIIVNNNKADWWIGKARLWL